MLNDACCSHVKSSSPPLLLCGFLFPFLHRLNHYMPEYYVCFFFSVHFTVDGWYVASIGEQTGDILAALSCEALSYIFLKVTVELCRSLANMFKMFRMFL